MRTLAFLYTTSLQSTRFARFLSDVPEYARASATPVYVDKRGAIYRNPTGPV